jgi:hypothetical protein
MLNLPYFRELCARLFSLSTMLTPPSGWSFEKAAIEQLLAAGNRSMSWKAIAKIAASRDRKGVIGKHLFSYTEIPPPGSGNRSAVIRKQAQETVFSWSGTRTVVIRKQHCRVRDQEPELSWSRNSTVVFVIRNQNCRDQETELSWSRNNTVVIRKQNGRDRETALSWSGNSTVVIRKQDCSDQEAALSWSGSSTVVIKKQHCRDQLTALPWSGNSSAVIRPSYFRCGWRFDRQGDMRGWVVGAREMVNQPLMPASLTRV